MIIYDIKMGEAFIIIDIYVKISIFVHYILTTNTYIFNVLVSRVRTGVNSCIWVHMCLYGCDGM